MRIYKTINCYNNLVLLKNELEYLKNTSVNGVRINLCKFAFEDLYSITEEIIKVLILYVDRYEIIFDLPYPKNKSRIIKFSIDEALIKRDTTYRIYANINNIQNSNNNYIIIDTSAFANFISVNKILYFGDGEGAFRIIEIKEHYIEVVALNDFEIYLNKSILCGFVKDYNICIETINLICYQFLETKKPTLLLSFLECENELLYLKENLKYTNINLVPKIEANKAYLKCNELLTHSSGVLIARGDLALLNPIGDFYDICKVISNIATKESKRLYVATDILKSLNTRFLPSRADIIDIATIKELNCTDLILPHGTYDINHYLKIINMILTAS